MLIKGDDMFNWLVNDLLAEDPHRSISLNDVKAAARAHGALIEIELYVRCKAAPEDDSVKAGQDP
ncbi:hypothetical protein E2F50_01025 [Rhizobium deserti]|uniref:Uncharacterized protein n=1 Tax=Rhizobium deserti TaxID=2547961 RepID=A0A4R5ULR2_9HYPH|nr:hypothetical protein [Rhizobium deserti]TDK38766.1 hypothetical protein E2F50_01025 [Rhizobium deserti]